MRKMYILTLRLFETSLARHIYKSVTVEFSWKLLSFFFFPPPLPGEQGLHGENRWKHSPPYNVARVQIPASTPYVGKSLLLVLSLAPRVFCPGTPLFPSPQKTNTSKFNSIWNEWTRLNEFIRTPKSFVGKQITIYNRSSPFTTFRDSRSCLQARYIHHHWPAIFCLRLHVLFPCRCC